MTINGNDVPYIVSNPEMYGSKAGRGKTEPTRHEILEFIQKNLPKAYQEYMGLPMPSDFEGIVTIQMGSYPHTCDIFLNPSTSDESNGRVVRIKDKVMQNKGVVLFEAHTYWYGVKKMTELASSGSVLLREPPERAAAFIAKQKDLKKVDYVGEKLVDFGKGRLPYKVFFLSKEEQESGFYLFFNLLNGGAFIVPRLIVPEMNDLPEKKIFGSVVLLKRDVHYIRR